MPVSWRHERTKRRCLVDLHESATLIAVPSGPGTETMSGDIVREGWRCRVPVLTAAKLAVTTCSPVESIGVHLIIVCAEEEPTVDHRW